MRLIRTLLCVVLVVLPSTLFGQSYTGTIIGTLKDTSGAVIPAANVTITNQQTARTESTTTDIEGRYISVPLTPGVYRVEASLQGFRGAARPDITVQVNSTVVIDFTLEVGQLTDQVEVRADATLLETDSGTVGKVVDNRRILELPLNTRNVYSLIFLTPGVAGTIGNNYNSMSYSVNGARPTMMDTVIDGVTASFPTVNGFTGISVFPSVDAIQEFKVLGANYPAEYGRSLGSVLNVVYKSGTNQFHGSGYEFFRDSAFDANNFFAKQVGTPLGDFRRSQFGGVAGGPVRRNRTFYMGSYEGLREQRQGQQTTTVPTLAQRRGDFSQTLAQTGQLIRIFDPFTTRPNPAGGFIRDAFDGNVIPANRIDPVALQGAELFPVAEPTRQFCDRCAELLFDRNAGAQRRQRRRAHRSPDIRQSENLRPLFVSKNVQRSGHLLSGGHRRRRGTGQRAEPRAQFRHRLQPDDLEHDGHERAYRLRAYVVPLRQPGTWLQAIESRAAGLDRR